MLQSTLTALQQIERETRGTQAIEYQIEEQRAAMNNDNLTPVTEDTFMAWKEKRKSRKLKMSQKVVIAQTGNKKKQKKGATGRAIFAVDPSLNTKDAEGASDAIKRPSEDEGEGGDTTHVHIDADEEERVAAEILEI
jgi:hypothetical protein